MRDGLAKAALALNRWSERYLPSALGIAALLTLVSFLLAFAFGFRGAPAAERALRVAASWGGGLSGLLAFAMQMCLVMLTGYIVAESPLFRRLLDAGKTLTGDDEDDKKERKSETAKDGNVLIPPALKPGAAGAGPRYPYPTWEELRQLSPEERRLILDYFRRLNDAR